MVIYIYIYVVAKTKEVKSGSDMVESSKEGCGSKKGCFANDADL
jgi:hypothetical protein